LVVFFGWRRPVVAGSERLLHRLRIVDGIGDFPRRRWPATNRPAANTKKNNQIYKETLKRVLYVNQTTQQEAERFPQET